VAERVAADSAERRVSAARLPASLAALVCVLVAIFLALNGRDASVVRTANEQGAAAHYDQAIATAQRVHRSPADLHALEVVARANTAAQRLHAADLAWAALARRDPNNWEVHYDWARSLAILRGAPEDIALHYRRARELNPRLPAP
jgi:hypothetical protein